jgi:hypothetical protein
LLIPSGKYLQEPLQILLDRRSQNELSSGYLK